MRTVLKTIAFIFAFGFCSGIFAQKSINDEQKLLEQAEEAFQVGHFTKVDSLLDNCVSRMQSQNRVKAYRLLALSALYTDRTGLAEDYSAKLLENDPFFTAYDDNQRFNDILERLKKGSEKITTASAWAESLEETPVPVTLITEEMINNSGARTLQDLLCLYVPGITRIEGIESSVSMRGIFSNMQEDILIMQDGHRLNSGMTNAQSPDYRISLDKIKQIEVLRGPASSLYGNVALAAVVNVITKQGSEMDGGQLTAVAGMHNSFGGSAVYGRGNLKSDILGWAGVYYSNGEKYDTGSDTRYIGGFNQKPAFDIGLNARWGDVSMNIMAQHCKQVPFYNMISAGKEYNYDKYSDYNGNKPGTSRMTINSSLDYKHTWNKFTLNGSAYFGTEETQIYNVLGDNIDKSFAQLMLLLVTGAYIEEPNTTGSWQSASWRDYSLGANINGSLPYKWGRQRGNILFGCQFDYFIMSSSCFNLGYDFYKIHSSNTQGIDTGSEWTLSPYFQWKHYFTEKLIFNGGIRFDNKNRYSGNSIRTASPRIAFIWMPTSVSTFKIGYARSFVDAPYLYRASQVRLLSGGPDMLPQYLNSIQISSLFQWKPIGLKCEVNMFYNIANNLVQYSAYNLLKTLVPFTNSGKLSQGGIEAILEYHDNKTMANMNMTLQHTFDQTSEYIGTTQEHWTGNEPKFNLNLTAGRQLYQNQKAGEFWLRANLHVQSGMYLICNNYSRILEGEMPTTITWQNGKVMLNAGFDWKWKKRLTVSLDAYNLTNTSYGIGTLLEAPMPTEGARFMAKLRLHL
ncbi:MAG: TonB-dependent receptor [Bacteroidaceae bacterium]|nr:TonB-dependent receptor [Bacteroidaceae bacterium]